MAVSRRHVAFVEETDLASRTDPCRRDSDWGGHPRTHEEDVAWAARRAGVSMAAATMHARDGGTGAHSDDVVHLCDAIADELGVHGHDRAELLAAAQLHDVGKVAISQEILDKSGPLEDHEWESIHQHTVVGEQIVQSVPELHHVGRLVRHTHERWDGGGYPDGLVSEEIPLGSRIVFCADAFHAIRSDRPYRQGRSARAALEEVKCNAGSQFDPQVVDALVASAGQMRSAGRVPSRRTAKSHRSRRLLTLLLALAIGGSALAAGGSHLVGGGHTSDKGRAAPASAARTGSEAGGASGQSVSDRAHADTPGRRTERGKAHAAARAGNGPKGGSTGPSRSPAASPAPAAAPGTTHAVPRRRRVGRPTAPGRPQNPGRSQEAPGRPAVPGKPVGGAPGRSEEAPGKPSPTPPAKPKAGSPQSPTAKAPKAQPKR